MPNLPFSPAARAFFEALDQHPPASSSKNEKTSTTTTKHHSSAIQKKIQVLGWRNRYSQDDYYPLVINHTEFKVKQVQRGEIDGTFGTGATVWPASLVLCKYLERHPHLVRNKRIVDLGAGTGITSITAALLGASHCTCTDGEETVVQLARDNVNAWLQNIGTTSTAAAAASDSATSTNDCPSSMVHVTQYWWGSGSIQSEADVVLVSDCVLPKLYPIGPLVEALDELLNGPQSVAILSYEYRYYESYDPKEKFVELCAAKNLQVETIPLEEQDSIYSVDDIEIWHVTRKVC